MGDGKLRVEFQSKSLYCRDPQWYSKKGPSILPLLLGL